MSVRREKCSNNSYDHYLLNFNLCENLTMMGFENQNNIKTHFLFVKY